MKIFINSFLFLYLSFSLVSAQTEETKQTPSRQILEEIKSHTSGIAIWWTGHNGWLIKSDNILIGTDLAIKEVNIPSGRINVAEPRKPFSIGEVKIEPIRAIHGNSKWAVFYDANLEDCGYLITINGKKILQMGDTVLLEDHFYIKHVDILFFSPTEHNTHIDPSVILINELEPDYIFPQHRNTFRVTEQNRYWTSGYPYEVKFRLSKQHQKNYYVLEMGEKIIIE